LQEFWPRAKVCGVLTPVRLQKMPLSHRMSHTSVDTPLRTIQVSCEIVMPIGSKEKIRPPHGCLRVRNYVPGYIRASLAHCGVRFISSTAFSCIRQGTQRFCPLSVCW
jgi:hypothetical protein